MSGHDVHIRGVGKRYGDVAALAGIDLDVASGRFLVLLGPSGSGKSTLVRALAGVERIDEGLIVLGDRVVADGPRHLPAERRDLAMVFQDYALWPHLSVRGNVAFALRRRHLSRPEAARRVAEVLEQVGLARLAERYPQELSGGEQQRVALARAVVARPALLLFDEPLSNLDADLRERLRVQIATVTRESGATAVYITHDQAEAFALADEVGVLSGGRLVQLGRPEEIYHRPASAFVARFTGTSGELSGTVTTVEARGARVRVGEEYLHTCLLEDSRPGDRLRVLIRPAATGLADDGRRGEGRLAGTVVDVAYRGRGYDHVVQTAGGELAGVFSSQARQRGERVLVVVDAQGCFGYPAASVPERSPSDLTPVSLST